MSRQIDADRLYEVIKNSWDTSDAEDFEKSVFVALATAPTIEQRKTGKWNFIGDQMFECTECGVCYTQSQFRQMRVRITDPEFPKFCPNCGADMRGEQDETD